MFKLTLVSFGILLTATSSFAYRSPDVTEIKNLIESIAIHQADFGAFPATWEELETSSVDWLDRSRVRLKERYAFLDANERPKHRIHGEILLISRRPFKDVTTKRTTLLPGIQRRGLMLTEQLRYGISILPGERLSILKLSEAEVSDLFNGQRVPLPATDSLPEREWVTNVRREVSKREIINVAMMAVVLLGAIGGLIVFRRQFFPKQPSG